jgi:hypothetical protein
MLWKFEGLLLCVTVVYLERVECKKLFDVKAEKYVVPIPLHK